MFKYYLYLFALLFVTIGISSCTKTEVANKSSNVHLNAQATHNFMNNKDEKDLELFLELDQVVLVREISMRIGTNQWDLQNPEFNSAYSWLSRNNGLRESVKLNFTNDSLSAMIAPKSEDYPDKYGTDWDAYEAADAKYQREVKKARAQILEKVFASMKKGEPVSFEIRGKIKNIQVTVPKSDVDYAIEVWDIYKQM